MSGLRSALALFTVLPVGGPGDLNRREATVALRWFPLVGAAVGAVAGLPAVAVREWAGHAVLLGAALSVVLLVLLSRGLHLDGLADTMDGLGSRRPADRALDIMRRSDIGPFGVLAIALVLLVDVTAVASVDAGRVWQPAAALAVAAATGRLAALLAAHRTVASARAEGFGAYVAGSQSTVVLAVETVAVLALGGGLAAAVDASVAGWLAAQAAAVVVATAFRVHATRRLGGVTGDVFGALVEIGTALTLAGLALA
ncbi:MAG: adenosylcobinamide-GDP ribazoletransferase [Pseudonocardiales bacterium]|nr:adenosylcobinamide-GDP ribazoletransferase [Pseudonocardiales bacterium]